MIHLQKVAKYNTPENQVDLNKIIKTSTEGISTVVSIAYQTDWKNQVLNTTQYGEPLMRFTLCAIISFGAFLKLTYQSYGMAGLPIFLIKGTKSLEAESDEIDGTIQSVREELRRIQEKYIRNQK